MDRTLRRETTVSTSSISEKWRFQRSQSHLSSHELVSASSTAAQFRRQLKDGFLGFQVDIEEAKECRRPIDTEKLVRLLVESSGFGEFLGLKRRWNWGTEILWPIRHGWVVAIWGRFTGISCRTERLCLGLTPQDMYGWIGRKVLPLVREGCFCIWEKGNCVK